MEVFRKGNGMAEVEKRGRRHEVCSFKNLASLKTKTEYEGRSYFGKE